MRQETYEHSERVDLSETSDFFLALKHDESWRERLVTELRFGLRNHLRSSNSYQVNFPPGLLAEFGVASARTANILIPLTTREKRPLLNLNIAGPAGVPATVPARPSIAALQKEFLLTLVEQSPARKSLDALVDEDLLEALCVFSPSFFATTFFDKSRGDLTSALAAYLSSALRLEVSVNDIRRWRSALREVRKVLRPLAPKPSFRFSSSEELLLAIPELSPLPTSKNEIEESVGRFSQAVAVAAESRDASLLSALAEYGQRYELVVEVEVPLLEPSRVRVEEDLPLELHPRRGRYWVEQTFALGDARSAHLEARLDDANVEIPEKKIADGGGVEVRDLTGNDAKGWLESLRVTREAIAIYGSEKGRPRYVRIGFRLRVARHVMAATVLLAFLNLIAIVFTLTMDGAAELASRLAVLAIPTTVAATFVLVREQTALATRLQTFPRLVLALSALGLWVVVSVRLVGASDPSQGVVRPIHPPDSRLVAPAGRLR